jgi:hypothetical protein
MYGNVNHKIITNSNLVRVLKSDILCLSFIYVAVIFQRSTMV